MKAQLQTVIPMLFAGSLLAACFMGVGSGYDGPGGSGSSPAPSGYPSSTPVPPSSNACGADPWATCQALLAAKCLSCHGATPAGGAPMSLVTAAQLKAPSKSNPALNYAQVSIERMKANTMPPGGGAVSDAQILQTWIDLGYPTAAPTCDAGTPSFEAGPDPYNTPVQCSSGNQGGHQTEGNGSMNPGEDCLSCHGVNGNNEHKFVLAGTVYKTAHEPNDCAGASITGLTVSGTDKNGATFSAKVNSAGNFYVTAGTLQAPFSGLLVKDGNGKTRGMAEAAPGGNCNGCHTEMGAAPYAPSFPTKAPGRVMAP